MCLLCLLGNTPLTTEGVFCSRTNFCFSNKNPLFTNYLADHFFENVNVSKSKLKRVVFGYLTLCTKHNRSMIVGLEYISATAVQ